MVEKVVIGRATLYLGDAREVLPKLRYADALITDPPYGVDLGAKGKDMRGGAHGLAKARYAGYDDTPENFREIIVPITKTAIAYCGRALVFVAAHRAWELPQPDAIGGIFLPSGSGRHRWGFASFAHALLYGQAPELHRGARPTGISSTFRANKSEHPCAKPLPWMQWAVLLASREGERVLDPFMGSGTTGVACAQLGRRFVGIEIEPRYFDIACRRIDEAQRQLKHAA